MKTSNAEPLVLRVQLICSLQDEGGANCEGGGLVAQAEPTCAGEGWLHKRLLVA